MGFGSSRGKQRFEFLPSETGRRAEKGRNGLLRTDEIKSRIKQIENNDKGKKMIWSYNKRDA